jgi:high affinity choline transporter 7
LPFMLTSEYVDLTSLNLSDWTGEIKDFKSWIKYLDDFALIICGGIPWQPYYQRALAVKTTKNAQILSVVATLGCFVFMIPPILVGGIAKATNWTDFTTVNITADPSLALPAALAFLPPYWVSIFGLAAVR